MSEKFWTSNVTKEPFPELISNWRGLKWLIAVLVEMSFISVSVLAKFNTISAESVVTATCYNALGSLY